jgi:hypothetical protein
MGGGEIIAIVAIVGACSVAGITWSMAIWAQMRARAMLHAERLAAIEKGIALPEEPGKAGEAGEAGGKQPGAAGGKESPTHALGTGLFWLFVGIGFILSMRVVYPESTGWGWGILVVALGLAYLAGYWLTRGKADADADAARQDAGGN